MVTANRTGSPKEEVPSAIQIISEREMAATNGDQLTDVLKKNSSIDVIQYPGVLSGVSIRGFRPEADGITKHHLVLIDGRPAGASNIATILKDNVARIELLKGPASALYGGEAMGGVVNVITRQSTGELAHKLTLGAGSFGTHRESVLSGGTATPGLDYDASFSNKSQLDDYRMGNGVVRKRTSFQERHAALRLGSPFHNGWRVDAKGDWYMGRDIGSPGALDEGETRQSTKDLDRYGGDLALSGGLGHHALRAKLYVSHEKSDYTYRYTGQPVYKSYQGNYSWIGVQLQDTYTLAQHEITMGLDYQLVGVETKRWSSSGERAAPYSPDNGRENVAFFLDGTFRVLEERLVLNAGLRFDNFRIRTEGTPYLPSAVIGSARFSRLSPRAGAKLFFTSDRSIQLHSTIGTAFVPPQATQMFLHAETPMNGITMVTRGNPNLGPEWSLTWDAGLTLQLESGLRLDATYFDTRVHDKIARAKLDDTVTTYVNADSATLRGLEIEATWDPGAALHWKRKVQFFANATWLPQIRETLTSGGARITRDIYNVSKVKYNAGVDYDDGALFGRLAARYMGVRKDNDWYTPGYPEISYGPFILCDLSLGMRFLERHTVSLSIENALDEFYFEKPEFPLPGRAIFAAYTLDL